MAKGVYKEASRTVRGRLEGVKKAIIIHEKQKKYDIQEKIRIFVFYFYGDNNIL